TGQLVQFGGHTYSDYGVRSLRGKTKQGVDAGDFYFKGTFLRGVPGQKIKLSLKNVGQENHNFSLPAQQIDQDLPPKSDRFEVEVTVPTSGAVRFFCKLHTDRGMNGQLITEGLAPQP